MQAVFWFIDDWIGSTKRRQMDFAEQSGYFLLLCHAAKSDDGSLPVDDYSLASLSELGPLWIEKPGMSPITRGERIRACFFEREGRLFNARLLREFERRAERSETARTNANRRWDAKRMQNECGDDANAHANMDAKECSLDLRSQTLDPRAKNKEKTSCASDEARDAVSSASSSEKNNRQIDDWFNSFWREYIPLRSRGKSQAKRVFARLVKTEETFQAVMTGLASQREEMLSRDPQFRCYAQVWLHQRRWEDPAPAELPSEQGDSIEAALRQTQFKELA